MVILFNSLVFFFILKICLATEVKVNTTSGVVLGQTIDVLDHTLNQFLGIPYAEPPVGSLRFAKPKPIKQPLPNVIDATKPRNWCYQFGGLPNFSEDCLFLNIWSPNTLDEQQLKPVMFFIHGGGLVGGSSYEAWYNGSALAAHDIVLVTINYRLGALGFLYGADPTAPGNVGFFDQVLALRWVRDNIHLFGGDSDQITIFGESSGSWSVSAHLMSPVSKGLFKRAIMQSGSLYYIKNSLKTAKSALVESKQLAKQLNCTGNKNWLSCLRNVDPKEILEVNSNSLLPVIGTEFLPLSAQNAFKQNKFNKDIDLIVGITKDEGSSLATVLDPQILLPNLTRDDFIRYANKLKPMFPSFDVNKSADFYLRDIDPGDSHALKWTIFDFNGDLILKCPTYLFAKQYADHSNTSKLFFYDLTYELQYTDPVNTSFAPGWFDDTGVPHGVDIVYVFGLPLLNSNWKSKRDIELSEQIVEMWTTFAKSGKPNDDWRPFHNGNDIQLIKDLNPIHSDEYFIDLFAETCDGFWKSYF